MLENETKYGTSCRHICFPLYPISQYAWRGMHIKKLVMPMDTIHAVVRPIIMKIVVWKRDGGARRTYSDRTDNFVKQTFSNPQKSAAMTSFRDLIKVDEGTFQICLSKG